MTGAYDRILRREHHVLHLRRVQLGKVRLGFVDSLQVLGQEVVHGFVLLVFVREIHFLVQVGEDCSLLSSNDNVSSATSKIKLDTPQCHDDVPQTVPKPRSSLGSS